MALLCPGLWKAVEHPIAGEMSARCFVLHTKVSCIIMQTACWPQGKPRAELGLEKVAWSLGDCCRVVKSGKEVLAAGQALLDVRGKQLM